MIVEERMLGFLPVPAASLGLLERGGRSGTLGVTAARLPQRLSGIAVGDAEGG